MPQALVISRALASCAFAGVVLLRALPSIAQEAASPAPAQPGVAARPASDPVFDILEFRVEGNSVLPEREIERAVSPFLGEQRHFGDVEGARKALEDVYQRAGYQTVFVDIPEQGVAGGVIRLRVIEGRVGQERVTGARYYEHGQIRAGMRELVPGNVPDFNAMQQQLAQVNKQPDRQVAPILTAGKVPGTVDVNLSVKDSFPLHGDLEDDNHASPFTTSNRLNASLHYDNLWQRQHSISLNYQLSPKKPSETNVGYATYLWRFADSEDVASAYYIRSNSKIAVVGSATILGDAKIGGLRYIHPLGSGTSGESSYFHALTFGIDRKAFGQTNISAQTGNVDPYPAIAYTPLSLAYGATLARESQTVQIGLSLASAPRGILGNSDDAFRSRRAKGGASWLDWKPSFSIDRWVSRRWALYGAFDGQYSNDALISNEQYITGGADSVRGYRESEVSGDRGVRGTIEVRFHPFGRPGADGRRLFYVELFGDTAQVRLVDPQGPELATSIVDISSTGFGLHAQGWHGVHAAIDFAKALKDGGKGVNGYITAKGAKRVEASAGVSF